MKNKAPRKKPAVNRVYYIYVGILAVLFFTFHTIPFLKGVMYSFTDWRGYGEWNFVGLRNYIHMFSDVDTGNAYLFTFKFAGTSGRKGRGCVWKGRLLCGTYVP